ncbi:hypothetical protein DFH09DRAFT_1305769 [Mycena vulgaris]|nr:hypothetical protein DFH09DRAFT_1305769 [Mycena vulgaris]
MLTVKLILSSLRHLNSRDTSFLDHLQPPVFEALFLIHNADALPSPIRRSAWHLNKMALMDCRTDRARPKPAAPPRGDEDLSDLCPNLISFALGAIDWEFADEESLGLFTTACDTPPPTVLVQIQKLAHHGLDVAFLAGEVEIKALTQMEWSDPS